MHAYAIWSANHGREHDYDEFGRTNFSPNRQLQAPTNHLNLTKSPTTDPFFPQKGRSSSSSFSPPPPPPAANAFAAQSTASLVAPTTLPYWVLAGSYWSLAFSRHLQKRLCPCPEEK